MIEGYLSILPCHRWNKTRELSGGVSAELEEDEECVEQKENRSVKRVPPEVWGATVTWEGEVGRV